MTNHLNADYVAQEIAVAGQLTVKQLMELSGKAETTVRTVLKTMVEESRIVKVDGVKPATYRMTTEAEAELEAMDSEPEYDVEYPIELDEDAEAKLDEILESITAPVETPKVKKTRRVARTDVPVEHNQYVRLNGERMLVTDAFALLADAPLLAGVDEAYAWANTALDRGSEGDHSPCEIVGVYYETVAAYLELLLDEEAITRPVWYGRTCRLRHLVVGHGRGTASAKPVGKSTDK